MNKSVIRRNLTGKNAENLLDNGVGRNFQMEQKIKKIALLTGGGDCPGLNAVIRAVTRTAILNYGIEVIGDKIG